MNASGNSNRPIVGQSQNGASTNLMMHEEDDDMND